MQKSLRNCDISSKPAIKGKAGHLPGKNSLWSPNHGPATCSLGITGLLELREHPVLLAPGETGNRDKVYQELLKGVQSQVPAGLRDSCRTVSRTCLHPSCTACYLSLCGTWGPYDNTPSALPNPPAHLYPLASWQSNFPGIQTRHAGLCSPSASTVVKSASFRVNRPTHSIFSQAINLTGPQFPHLKIG